MARNQVYGYVNDDVFKSLFNIAEKEYGEKREISRIIERAVIEYVNKYKNEEKEMNKKVK